MTSFNLTLFCNIKTSSFNVVIKLSCILSVTENIGGNTVNKISDITRQDIFDIIKDGFVEKNEESLCGVEYADENKIYMPFYGRLDEIKFFSRLYDLESLPSYDNRYTDALGDISCHLGWGDYEECWFFQDRRFKLMQSDGDEPLLRFICEMLHPAVRIENSPWKSYLEKFNELLHADGYELFAAQHISGRDIYQAREYVDNEKPLFPDSLFSERYKELIHYGDGTPVDNISGMVEYNAKKHLCKVMFEFAEPMRIQRSRYDNWTDNSDALSESIYKLNEFLEFPLINLDMANFSHCLNEELLAPYFTPFIFDIIEFQFDELSNREKSPFQSSVNASLRKDNVPFQLTDRGLIEPIDSHEVLSSDIISKINDVAEPGINELLNEAVERHMQPTFQAHRDAVEKIWDALERLKTYYADLDKKASINKIVNDMSNGQSKYFSLFNDEFNTLTTIGNSFRIRHHETNKIEINDIRYYDYFFNRCLSLIATAIQYLE